jgi:Reverse transcriptase (RNA-dependent DNA polymerase)
MEGSSSPAIWWATIRKVLILVLIYGWATLQIDFILVYPQAKVECDLYMKIPKGSKIRRGTNRTHVLKLLQNLFGQKQAGRVWNQHLHKILIELGWSQSQVNDCLYYKRDVLFWYM